jgi:hypothetical protein
MRHAVGRFSRFFPILQPELRCDCSSLSLRWEFILAYASGWEFFLVYASVCEFFLAYASGCEFFRPALCSGLHEPQEPIHELSRLRRHAGFPAEDARPQNQEKRADQRR